MIRTKNYAWLLGTTAATALWLGLSPAAQADQASSSANIETVTVTGSRFQALDVKKQASVIIDIAPLDQIRSLPDANAAEALQRLPGISMESDSAQAASSTSAAWMPISTARPMMACA